LSQAAASLYWTSRQLQTDGGLADPFGHRFDLLAFKGYSCEELVHI
jgi:hypothetical protein